MAEAGRVFQRLIEKQRKDERCRLEDANGNRNEWEDRRTISVLAWTVAGRSSDSNGGPWPLYRMYKRHRQWTLLLHASVGRLHSESTSDPAWCVGRNFCGYLILRFFSNRKTLQNIVPANNSNNKVNLCHKCVLCTHHDQSLSMQ